MLRFVKFLSLVFAFVLALSSASRADLIPPPGGISFVTCDSIMVNTVNSTGSSCTTASCGLDGAIAFANACATPAKIVFSSDTAKIPASTIDLAGFTLPLEITGSNITLTARETNISGAASNRINLKPQSGSPVIKVKSGAQSTKLIGLIFPNADVEPIVIDAGAKDTDIQEMTSPKPFKNDLDGDDYSDISETKPLVFVRPYTSGSYSVYIISSIGASVRFYKTSGNGAGDLIQEYSIDNSNIVPVETWPLLDTAGSVLDASKTIYAGALSLNKDDQVITAIKLPGKNIFIGDTLSPFFTDSDSDSLPDSFETQVGTDPSNGDSDGDGTSDYYEVIEQENQVPRTKKVGSELQWAAMDSNNDGKIDAQDSSVHPSNSPGGSSSGSSGGCSLRPNATTASSSFLIFSSWLLMMGMFKWHRGRA